MSDFLSLALLLQVTGTRGGALPLFLFQIAMIFGIFYFLMIRPQQKQKKQHEERLRNIKKGDEIVTAGGIIGEVVHIRDTMKDGQRAPAMDDRVTIKSGDSRLIIERARIAKVVEPVTQTAAGDKTP
jgi:preprotein translocase subunit YajC